MATTVDPVDRLADRIQGLVIQAGWASTQGQSFNTQGQAVEIATEALAGVQAVLNLHQIDGYARQTEWDECTECYDEYPCATVRLLTGQDN